MYKIIFIILFLLSNSEMKGQTGLPKGFPNTTSNGWIRYGYLQSDSGQIIASRDTNFATRFAGTMVYWQHAGVDSTLWVSTGRTSGAKWFKIQAGGISSSQWTTVGSSIYYNNPVVVGKTTAASASAILDIVSTTKGILPPRMDSTQMIAISSPSTGLLIYNTTTQTNWMYNGSQWKNISYEKSVIVKNGVAASVNGDTLILGRNPLTENTTIAKAGFNFNLTGTGGVGIGTTTPDASSSLDIVSTNSGLLIPRMTAVQKNAISSPATSLMIYQTDGTAGYYYYNGAAWVSIGSVGGVNIYNSDGYLTGDRRLVGDPLNSTYGLRFDSLERFNITTFEAGGPSSASLSMEPASAITLAFNGNDMIFADATEAKLLSPNNTKYLQIRNDSVNFFGITRRTSVVDKYLSYDTLTKRLYYTDATNINIYNSDGTVTGNRMVNVNGNTIVFSNSTGFNVTEVGANPRIAIGTTYSRIYSPTVNNFAELDLFDDGIAKPYARLKTDTTYIQIFRDSINGVLSRLSRSTMKPMYYDTLYKKWGYADAASSGITVGTTTITSGTSGRIAFNNSGVYGESANLFFNNSTGRLTIGGITQNTDINTPNIWVSGGLDGGGYFGDPNVGISWYTGRTYIWNLGNSGGANTRSSLRSTGEYRLGGLASTSFTAQFDNIDASHVGFIIKGATSQSANEIFIVSDVSSNPYLTVGGTGNVGIGTGTITAQLHTTGTVRFANFGAGAATFDASGNISSVSDERLKYVQGNYKAGLNEVMKINPILYKWRKSSGMETQHTYAGFSAQNIRKVLGDNGSGINSQGYLSIQDRAIMASMVNAIKEQQAQIDTLKKQLKKLTK